VTIKELEEARAAIEQKGHSVAAPQGPSQFEVGGDDVFSGGGTQSGGSSDTGSIKGTATTGVNKGAGSPKTGTGDKKETGGALLGKGVKVGGAGEGGATAAATTTQNANWEPPDHCMIRFFDSAVEPGKTYEYRFKIKLTNPNKDKAKEVAYKELADKPFVEANWIELKQRIAIPPDFRD